MKEIDETIKELENKLEDIEKRKKAIKNAIDQLLFIQGKSPKYSLSYDKKERPLLEKKKK